MFGRKKRKVTYRKIQKELQQKSFDCAEYENRLKQYDTFLEDLLVVYPGLGKDKDLVRFDQQLANVGLWYGGVPEPRSPLSMYNVHEVSMAAEYLRDKERQAEVRKVNAKNATVVKKLRSVTIT